MKVNVTVCFPQTFEYEFDESLPVEQIKDAIREHAVYLMETSESDPIITSCSQLEFID